MSILLTYYGNRHSFNFYEHYETNPLMNVWLSIDIDNFGYLSTIENMLQYNSYKLLRIDSEFTARYIINNNKIMKFSTTTTTKGQVRTTFKHFTSNYPVCDYTHTHTHTRTHARTHALTHTEYKLKVYVYLKCNKCGKHARTV